MSSQNFSDELTIREITYTIRMKDKDKGFGELHEILVAELTRFEDTRRKNEKPYDAIYEFLKTNIERSIVVRDKTHVYFLDYQNHPGFTIDFKLLVVAPYVHYGSIRQALDYLIKDTIGDYFEELLERHLPASVSVHSADNELYDIPGKRRKLRTGYADTLHSALPLILATLALFFTLLLGMAWFLTRSPATDLNGPSDANQDKYLQMLIEEKVNRAVQKVKADAGLHQNLREQADTLHNTTEGPAH